MKYLILSFIVFLVFACKSRSESVNREAASKIHLESESIEASLAGTIDSLIQIRNQLAIQGRGLTPEEIAFNNEVTDIEASILRWRDNFPEIAQVLRDSAGHVPASASDASPKRMLDLQMEFRDSILAIQKRVTELLQK